MQNDPIGWAAKERAFIQIEIKWFKAGATLISPSGDDITAMKLSELEARLEDVQKVLEEHLG